MYIIHEILTLTRDGALKSGIMREVNLSFRQTNEYLAFLLDVKMIEVTTNAGKKYYSTTKKGEKYLRSWERIKGLLVMEGLTLIEKFREVRDRTLIEGLARKKLEKIYGTELPKRRLVVGYNSKGFPIIHEFDLVSDNREIIGEITSTKQDIRKVLADSVYLEKTEGKKKLLVLTNPEFYELFRSKCGGILSKDIEIILIK